MPLTALQLRWFRNLQPSALVFHPQLNIITGENGSGKSSLLESIFYLSRNASPFTQQLRHVIQHEQTKFILLAQLASENDTLTWPVALQKSLNGKTLIRCNGQRLTKMAELTQRLPLLLMTPDSTQWLRGSAKERRRFLDWGVFHVEPKFYPAWRRYQHALKQCNSALKSADPTLAKYWFTSMAEAGELIHQHRQLYFEKWQLAYATEVETLLPQLQLSFSLSAGWNTELSLAEALEQDFERARRHHHISVGIHRADIHIYDHGTLAKETLSRGQQKIITLMALLSQCRLLYQHNQQRCIFMIDDLTAELDVQHQTLIVEQLSKVHAQIFLSCIQLDSLNTLLQQKEHQLFHVEQGMICSLPPTSPL